jgi:hypothetical protein
LVVPANAWPVARQSTVEESSWRSQRPLRVPTAPDRAKPAPRPDGAPRGRAPHFQSARREGAAGVRDEASSGSSLQNTNWSERLQTAINRRSGTRLLQAATRPRRCPPVGMPHSGVSRDLRDACRDHPSGVARSLPELGRLVVGVGDSWRSWRLPSRRGVRLGAMGAMTGPGRLCGLSALRDGRPEATSA